MAEEIKWYIIFGAIFTLVMASMESYKTYANTQVEIAKIQSCQPNSPKGLNEK